MIIQSGERAGSEIPLEGERTTLGRLDSNDIAIPDTKASRVHARIFRSEGAYTLADLHSQNGTLLNGNKISRARLRHGDRITIGATEILFGDEDGPSASIGSVSAASATSVTEPTPKAQTGAGLAKDRDAFAGSSPDDIEISDGPLQFSPHRNDRTRSLLREDLGQAGGLFRLLVVIAGIVVLAGAAVGAAWLTLSLLR